MTLHEHQLALCYQLVNLCETFNHGISHSFPQGGKRCMYARIIGAAQAAKACGFYVAFARLPYGEQFSAVSVWETEYDTRMTKAVCCYDLFGKKQTRQRAQRNPQTWIYATTPHSTWGGINETTGAPTANLAFTGSWSCWDNKQTMKETLNSLYGTAAAELHPEYFDTDSVTGGAEQ